MTISKDLFLAILSMDSYHRGYQAGIAGLGGTGQKVGSATIGYQSQNSLDPDPADPEFISGFYAVTYSMGGAAPTGLGGQNVISYRGTDSANDYTAGWSVGGGFVQFNQAQQALDFFADATGNSYKDGAAENFILTGHSLGGGLAGFVSAMSGTDGVGYDNMPFFAAALIQHYLDNEDEDGILSPEEFLNVLDQLSTTATIPLELTADFDFREISTKNEILESVRDGSLQAVGTTLTSLFESEKLREWLNLPAGEEMFAAAPELKEYLDYFLAEDRLNDYGSDVAWITSQYDNIQDPIRFDPVIDQVYTDLGDRALVLHMIDLLIMLQYSADISNQGQVNSDAEIEPWRHIARPFLEAYFDNEIAETAANFDSRSIAIAAGFGALEGEATPMAMMRHAIAYSALDGDEGLVFGNTGIRAMIDDANELGTLVGLNAISDKLVPYLSETLVQFAGMMALQKVAEASNEPTDKGNALDGVLSFFTSDGQIDQVEGVDALGGAEFLVVDSSKATWNKGLDGQDQDRNVRIVGALSGCSRSNWKKTLPSGRRCGV